MVKKGNDINIRVKDGTIKANVMEVEKWKKKLLKEL
jgi:hypothetical protein